MLLIRLTYITKENKHQTKQFYTKYYFRFLIYVSDIKLI